MNTEQKYVGKGNSATAPPQTAKNTASATSLQDKWHEAHKRLVIQIKAGNEALHTYYGLKSQLESITEDMVADFDPNDLETHLSYWRDFSTISETMAELFTKINDYAEKLEDAIHEQRGRRLTDFNSELYNWSVAYWENKVSHRRPKKEDVEAGKGQSTVEAYGY